MALKTNKVAGAIKGFVVTVWNTFGVALDAGVLIVNLTKEMVEVLGDITPRLQAYISAFRGELNDIINAVESFIKATYNIVAGIVEGVVDTSKGYGLSSDRAEIRNKVASFLSSDEDESLDDLFKSSEDDFDIFKNIKGN